MDFEWDVRKAAANLRKHRVSFGDAVQIFLDPHRIEALDDRENYGEERWLTIGLSGEALLSVVYTLRGPEHRTYRFISVRKADAHERKQYREIHT